MLKADRVNLKDAPRSGAWNLPLEYVEERGVNALDREVDAVGSAVITITVVSCDVV